LATVLACSGVATPKPMAMGRVLLARILAVIAPMVSAIFTFILVTFAQDE